MKSYPDFERMVFAAEFTPGFNPGVLGDGANTVDSLVEGYANVFGNLDHNGDVVRPGAFRKTIQERVSKGLVPFLDSHQWDAAHTIGTVVEAHEDAKGLHFRARMSKAPSAADVRQKMLEGHIRRLSIGFTPVRESYERADEVPNSDAPNRKALVRHLHEVRLFEISAVPIAANEESVITQIKAAVPFQDLPLATRDRPWDAAAARERIARWAGGDDERGINWARYRRAFLWYEHERADHVDAYKLPIADVIGGELYAVPRGIFAAVATLQGARGGIEIDDEDAVRANLERYYDKMAREFDDPGLVAPWRRKSLDALVLAARAAGACEPGEVWAAMRELLGVLSAGDRARLLAELGAIHPVSPSASSLTLLKRRAALIRAQLAGTVARRRVN